MQSSQTSEKQIDDILDKCFADICKEFNESANKPTGLESLAREVYYRHILTWRRAWGSSQKCSYPDCDRTTSISSHTIQKAGPLWLIAENGHVLSPRVNQSDGSLTLESIGLNEASTFTGFCEAHERIFTYERNKALITDDDYELQIFRTVCRELKILQHQINSFRDALVLHKRLTTTEMAVRAMENLGDVFFKKHGVNRVSFQFNLETGITKLFRETINKCESNYDRTFRVFYQAFREDTNHRLTAPGLQAFLFKLPLRIPVALAGRSGFTVLEDGAAIGVDVILNVNPCVDETICFIASTVENVSLLERFLGMFRTDIERLSLIENWMLYGSDHWFIQPSTWMGLPPKRRAHLCKIIRDSDSSIGTNYDLSIFDASRIQLIDELKTALHEAPDNGFIQALITKETNKMQ